MQIKKAIGNNIMKYLRAKHKKIVDEENNEMILTGYAAANWMIHESFLFGTGSLDMEFKPFMRAEKMDRTRSIQQTIEEVCGKQFADAFWEAYYEKYIQRGDIEALARSGFNSIRLPLNARAFLAEEEDIIWKEQGFKVLDQVIDWCEEFGIYVILDLHAAVGGQSGIACDDGCDNFPHLFLEEEGKKRTIMLWKKIAWRYRDRAVVAGYELLNEPLVLPRWDSLLPELISFYKEAIHQIREIDEKHLLFIQGHRFASRLEVFPYIHDENWVMTIHIYETLPDLGLLGPILEMRDQLDVPVWIGETGGSADYLATLCGLLKKYGMGYNIWCLKAVERENAPTFETYRVPDGFDQIVEYAKRGGKKPSYSFAKQVMDNYLKQVEYKNCEKNEEIAAAVLRNGTFSIPAIGYDWHEGRYPYPTSCGYRREDRAHFVFQTGSFPYERNQFRNMEKAEKYGDFNHLDLVLSKDEIAGYAFDTGIDFIEIESLAHGPTQIEITVQSRKTYRQFDLNRSRLIRLSVESAKSGCIEIRCIEGEFQLHRIHFIKTGS